MCLILLVKRGNATQSAKYIYFHFDIIKCMLHCLFNNKTARKKKKCQYKNSISLFTYRTSSTKCSNYQPIEVAYKCIPKPRAQTITTVMNYDSWQNDGLYIHDIELAIRIPIDFCFAHFLFFFNSMVYFTNVNHNKSCLSFF